MWRRVNIWDCLSLSVCNIHLLNSTADSALNNLDLLYNWFCMLFVQQKEARGWFHDCHLENNFCSWFPTGPSLVYHRLAIRVWFHAQYENNQCKCCLTGSNSLCCSPISGWKPGAGSTNTMRIINAIDPKQGSLLQPITGLQSVPSFTRIENGAGSESPTTNSNPSLGALTNEIGEIKFF